MTEKLYRHPYFGALPYLEQIPKELENADGAPLLVFLHGAGERGNEPERLYRQAIPKYMHEGLTLPCITVCPQCPEGKIWNDLVFLLMDFLESYIDTHRIDRTKISLTGISMGGYGTWAMAICFPELFRRIAPVCGGGTPWCVGLIQAKIWAFHGDADETVPPESSYRMVDAAVRNGKDAQLTVFHGIGHNSWDSAYQSTKVLEWLLGEYNR